MPLFKCEKCGCVENTALSNYWTRDFTTDDPVIGQPSPMKNPALCSECDPQIGRWHGEFPRRQWTEADAKVSGMPQEA